MAEQKPRAARSRKQIVETEAVAETVAKRPKATAAKPAKQAAANKKTTSRSRKKPGATVRPDEIAVRAYLLWEHGEPGDATDHWLRAEQELVAA
jgi:hypothetical protein